MLIFVKGTALAQIIAGQKTATVRPWRTCTLKPGAVLSFNGKVRVVLLRVQLLACLEDLTADEARAAGYRSRAACWRALREYYPTRPLSAPAVILHFASPTQ